MEKIFKGKNVLITGGAGSIGSEIVKQVLCCKPSVVRILDNDEGDLFRLEQELNSHGGFRTLLGDVRDKERLKRAVEDIDIVFHAAALKHVPMCEYNPFEAIKTNVLGTQNLIEVAIEKDVEKMITISTDKAANPVNTMGATKLLAERLTIDANFYKGRRKTTLSCVRFGNVLKSRGSVIDVFKNQISNGGPITLTDPDMRRFVMRIKQSVNLILQSVSKARGGEIFILKMPVLRLGDLAEILVDELAPRYGYKPGDIEVEIIGVRPGEKFYEELIGEGESNRCFENRDMFVVMPEIECRGRGYGDIKTDLKPMKTGGYTSRDERLLGKEEIRDLLRLDGVI